MTELERRALLGDKDAQKECTEKGIMLPCQHCGGIARFVDTGLHEVNPEQWEDIPYYTICFISCTNCSHESHRYRTEIDFNLLYKTIRISDTCNGRILALEDWNTRPAPPIGRCGECRHWYKGHCAHGTFATEPTESDFYCGNFEPKESEEK